MNSSLKIFLLSVSIFFTSCASIHSGRQANQVQGPTPFEEVREIKVSGERIKTYSTDYLTLIDLTFQNTSDDWIRLKDISLDLGQDEYNQKVNIIAGQDLVTWAKAITRKVKIDDLNRSIFLSAVSLGGFALAATAKNDDLAAAGSVTFFSANTILLANSIYRNITELEKSNLFPDDHLYRDFSIPPGLFSKKWILLKINKKDIPRFVYLNLTSLDGRKLRYQLSL